MTAFAIGAGVAGLVAAFARLTGFDRDRAFYATVLIVVGHYYVLFAAMGGSTEALVLESMLMLAFVAAAVAGLKHSAWIVVAGLAAHGVFDAFHSQLVRNAGVPEWWPPFCLAFDVAAAALLAWLSRGAWRPVVPAAVRPS